MTGRLDDKLDREIAALEAQVATWQPAAAAAEASKGKRSSSLAVMR